MSVPKHIVAIVRNVYRLDWHGIHGVSHWARVRLNGLRLAKQNGANVKVIEHFAFLHDSCRIDDNEDPEHGPRAALFVESLAKRGMLNLSRHEIKLLMTAVSGHTSCPLHSDITIGTCWDADRLDLPRVDIIPEEKYMSTKVGQELARALVKR